MAQSRLSPLALPYALVTVEEAAAITSRWQQLAGHLAGKGETWDQAAKSLLPAAEYQALTESITAAGVALTDAAALEGALRQLTADLAALPLLDLEVAWAPSQAFVEEIMEWLKHHGPGSCRVRLHTKPELVGGLMVGYAGRVLDYSLATRLDDYGDQLR